MAFLSKKLGVYRLTHTPSIFLGSESINEIEKTKIRLKQIIYKAASFFFKK